MRTRFGSLDILSNAAMFLFGAFVALNSVTLKNIADDFALDYGQSGALSFARGLTLATFVAVSGFIARLYGKKPFVVLAMYACFAAGLATAFAPAYAALLLAFAVLGVGLGIIEALVHPLVAEMHPERVGWKMNELGVYYCLGMAVAALSGGALLTRGVDWRAPYVALGLASAVVGAFIGWAKFPPEIKGHGEKARFDAPLASLDFWLLGLAMALAGGTESGITFWGASFVQEQFDGSPLAGALGVALFAGLMVVGRLITMRAVRVIEMKTIILASALSGIVGIIGLILSGGVVSSSIFLALCGLAISPSWPTILALAAKRLPDYSVTMVLALLSTCGVAGYATLPWCIGVLADLQGSDLASSFYLMIPALAGVIVILTRLK